MKQWTERNKTRFPCIRKLQRAL